MKVTTTYETLDPHDIGWAIRCLKNGLKVYRKDWAWEGMWLELVPATENYYLPTIEIHTPNGRSCPYRAGQTDLLAKDWKVKE